MMGDYSFVLQRDTGNILGPFNTLAAAQEEANKLNKELEGQPGALKWVAFMNNFVGQGSLDGMALTSLQAAVWGFDENVQLTRYREEWEKKLYELLTKEYGENTSGGQSGKVAHAAPAPVVETKQSQPKPNQAKDVVAKNREPVPLSARELSPVQKLVSDHPVTSVPKEAQKMMNGAIPLTPQPEAEKPAPSKRKTNILPRMDGWPAEPCVKGSSQATMVDLLARPQGASLEELRKGLGNTKHGKPWQDNSIKTMFSWDLKNKGYGVEQRDDDRFYLVYPEGQTSPTAHSETRFRRSTWEAQVKAELKKAQVKVAEAPTTELPAEVREEVVHVLEELKEELEVLKHSEEVEGAVEPQLETELQAITRAEEEIKQETPRRRKEDMAQIALEKAQKVLAKH